MGRHEGNRNERMTGASQSEKEWDGKKRRKKRQEGRKEGRHGESCPAITPPPPPNEAARPALWTLADDSSSSGAVGVGGRAEKPCFLGHRQESIMLL